MKFYVSALVGVIIKVILRNARCNNKDIKYIVLIAFLSSVRSSAVFPVDCRRFINFGLWQIRIGKP